MYQKGNWNLNLGNPKKEWQTLNLGRSRTRVGETASTNIARGLTHVDLRNLSHHTNQERVAESD